MQTPQAAQSQSLGQSPSSPLRGSSTDAARFWEPRRLVYNLILAAVVSLWIALTWPHFRSELTPFSLLRLAILALIANLCYSAAYLVDIPMQSSALRATWLRWRWVLWSLGMLLAILIENYWIADEIYPFVR